MGQAWSTYICSWATDSGLCPALDRAVGRRAGDAEELRDLAGGVGAGAVQLHEVLLLRGGELGLATAELAGGLGDRHALARAGVDEVGLELGHHAEDVEQQSADGVDGVVDRSPEVQRDALLRQLVRDVRRIAQRAGETVELRDDEHVAGTAHGEGFAKAGSGSSLAQETVGNMHVSIVNIQRCKTVTLYCEILPGARDAALPMSTR